MRRDLPVLAARDLESELRSSIRGSVGFDAGNRALYATDASNYRQVPIGVVVPLDIEDVINTIAICRRHDVPVLPRGGGTSLAGQCCNVAVVIDFSQHVNHILEVDKARKLVRIEPGIVLDSLRRPLEREYDLTFGPDPATHSRCTLGGMMGNNSCGVHSIQSEFYGPGPRTSDNVHSLEILTYDGLRMQVGATSEEELQRIIAGGGRPAQIYQDLANLRIKYAQLIREKYPNIPRRVSGYALDSLLPENGFHVARSLIGSEGTCVTILNATLMLTGQAQAKSLVVLGFDDIFAAAEAVPFIRGFKPIGLEGVDDVMVNDLRQKGMLAQQLALLPSGDGWLFVEFGGDSKDAADASAREFMSAASAIKSKPRAKLMSDPAHARQMWILRESGLGATAFVTGQDDTWEGWEDSAVSVEQLAPYLREFRDLLAKYKYRGALYGHFGHGCVHTRINFDLVSAPGVARYRAFVEEAAHLVVRHGGSLSGEHGDGQSRAELLPIMFGDELVQAFREFKHIWDPDNRMNPGKVVDAYRLDENLRLGSAYNPANPETFFKFPEDHGTISRAALRCVGVGECRRHEGGTMCPSYMATREEKHSTRGRTHLLFEMLRGELIDDGWRNEHVHEALDLCLACKGCKHECPVQVDVATYKAEFLAHYYAGRLRPRAAYSMGLIHRWARWAAHMPRIANFFTQTPGLSKVMKAVGGIAQERAMPAFATNTFRNSWRPRQDEPTVILWTDTFNDHFYPRTLHAAVRVLEAAGHRVGILRRNVCCGRPLYDFGFLKTAQRLLRDVLDEVGPFLRRGVPIVGLEPSCTAVLRDEVFQLFPNDEDAQRLVKQTFLLGEFLQQHAPDWRLPQISAKAIVHGHCHQKAIAGMSADEQVLQRAGVDYQLLEAGCCGLAGSFGFEAAKYELSVQIGEHVLLPAVRKAGDDTVIIADGFSCRQQIEHGTGRQARHLAELIADAL